MIKNSHKHKNRDIGSRSFSVIDKMLRKVVQSLGEMKLFITCLKVRYGDQSYVIFCVVRRKVAKIEINLSSLELFEGGSRRTRSNIE